MKLFLTLLSVFLAARMSVEAQNISTFAGGGTSILTGIPATSAVINDPNGGVFDKNGSFYFAQDQKHIISKIDTNGSITTVAGTTVAGYNGDGIPATAAKLNFPFSVKVDSIGNLFISDHQNCRIRRIDISTGIITTVAGDGTPGFYGDGTPATNAKLYYPGDICFDSHGNLFISDPNNRRLRMINTLGIISTYAGTGSAGYGGDGGPATSAQITPGTLCFDSSGNLYVGDYTSGQARIAKINASTNIITTYAGTDTGYLFNGDGIMATSANISPAGIVFDTYGNLLIADGVNNRIREISTGGIIRTIAGTGIAGFSGDGGPASNAKLNQPESVVLDLCGNLYLADVNNARVRRIAMPPILTTPTIMLSGTTNVADGTTVTVNATVTSAGTSYLIHWLNHGIEFTTTTVPVITYTKAPGIDTITARVVPTGYGCWDSTTSARHIVSDVSTGVAPLNTGSYLMLYPNPAHASLTIISPSTPATITITNPLGQLMLTEQIKNKQTEINIQQLPSGLYLLLLTGPAGNRTVTRFVKQ